MRLVAGTVAAACVFIAADHVAATGWALPFGFAVVLGLLVADGVWRLR